MGENRLRRGGQAVVIVPASTANLGPGFDAVGCALGLHNRFGWRVAPAGRPAVTRMTGPESAGLPADHRNIARRSALRLLERAGVPSPEVALDSLDLEAEIAIPQSRGLGSSSTAIVGGVLGANRLLEEPLDERALLDLCVEIEGHPDNVTPAMHGGLVAIAAHATPVLWRRYTVAPQVRFVVAVPDDHVRTSDARAALRQEVPLADAVHNLSRVPLVLEALRTGELDRLRELLDDRLHQPHRKPLYRGYDALEAVAYAAGAAGFCVSGAGPTLLAVTRAAEAERVRAALHAELAATGAGGRALILPVDDRGAAIA
jgi:homoserine kinase